MKIGIAIFLSLTLVIIGFGLFGVYTVKLQQESMMASEKAKLTILSRAVSEAFSEDLNEKKTALKTSNTHPFLLALIKQSNSEFEEMPDRETYITIKDHEWITETNTPFIQAILQNNISSRLQRVSEIYKKEAGYPVALEIFITNKYGTVVGSTGKTTDYRQDDEDWWQTAKILGEYVDEISYDQSAHAYGLPVHLRIDDEEGKFVGVMKAVINVNDLVLKVKDLY